MRKLLKKSSLASNKTVGRTGFKAESHGYRDTYTIPGGSKPNLSHWHVIHQHGGINTAGFIWTPNWLQGRGRPPGGKNARSGREDRSYRHRKLPQAVLRI
jgi:hypothetical protein